MNPNLVYWQKVERAKRRSTILENSTGQDPENRPPSYVSSKDVGYVVEPQHEPGPRHMATVHEADPLPDLMPVHPSERGRMGTVSER
jgi:hypothetical protein